ncbi:MAG: hypothetical protein HY606_10555 [Planctomycetes bacterium]|nr:hypothetical protein [Planctomycetota bacterium]
MSRSDNVMELTQLKKKLPLVKAWIDDLLSRYSSQARSVSDFGFESLSKYFSKLTLAKARAVVIENVPMPPLTSLGLVELSDFEKGRYAGITFKNCYFIRTECISNESLHFHELVHVVQWGHLGVDNFLMTYALGLLENGYADSPLEVLASEHERNFVSKISPYNVEQRTKDALDQFLPEVLRKIQSV